MPSTSDCGTSSTAIDSMKVCASGAGSSRGSNTERPPAVANQIRPSWARHVLTWPLGRTSRLFRPSACVKILGHKRLSLPASTLSSCLRSRRAVALAVAIHRLPPGIHFDRMHLVARQALFLGNPNLMPVLRIHQAAGSAQPKCLLVVLSDGDDRALSDSLEAAMAHLCKAVVRARQHAAPVRQNRPHRIARNPHA